MNGHTLTSGRPLAAMAIGAGLLLGAAPAAGAGLPAPTGVSASTFAGGIRLAWSPIEPASAAESYHVYRSLKARGPYTVIGIAGCHEACEHVDRAVENGVRYFYVVRAYDAGGREGASSAEVSAQADTVAPSAGFRVPADGARFSGRGPVRLEGGAFDGTSGVAEVTVAIRRNDTQEWWNGSAWTAAVRPPGLLARLAGEGGARTWEFDASGVQWSQATSYSVRLGVRDHAGHGLSPAAVATVYVDSPAFLAVSVAAAPSVVAAGQVVHVTLLVANTGASDATSVDALVPVVEGSAGASPLSAPLAGGVPVLAPGEFATFSWAFSTTGAGILTFRGGARGLDAASGGAAATAAGTSNEVQVRRGARLDVAVTPTPANVRRGESFSVRVRVSNTGESEAQVTAVGMRAVPAGLSGALRGPDVDVPFRLRGGETRDLVWTGSASGTGRVAFTVGAAGVDEMSGASADAAPRTSAAVGIAGAPASLRLASSADSAPTGAWVAVAATVRDGEGVPVPGVRVDFKLLGGQAKVETLSAVSDEHGVADTALTLGARTGMCTVEGRAGGLLASLPIEVILPGGVGQVLSRNFFDPTRGETVEVQIRLPRAGRVRVSVFNRAGDLVAVLADEAAGAGERTLAWNGRTAGGEPAANGVYYISVQAGSSLVSRRVIVLKR